MPVAIDRPMANRRARRMMGDVVVAAPVAPGPDRPRLEAAAAVRADAEQDVLDARGAERALEAADARVGRVRRQGAIAVFARGTKLEHGGRPKRQPAVSRTLSAPSASRATR